mgnify:CR=1 FL=1
MRKGKGMDALPTSNLCDGAIMKKVNPYHVLNLNPQNNFPCLSLYASSERELVALIGKAEELGVKRYDAKTLDTLLKPIHGFMKRKEEKNFPIALFSTRGFGGFSNLPFTAEPLAVVSDSFHIKPLIKWMQREHPFALLELRELEAVLYQGSLGYFEEIERLSYRELRTMDGVFNALDRAVYRSIQSSRVPLLLAGDLELIEAYKSVSGYKAIVDDSILDPYSTADRGSLHAAAISTLEPFLEQKEASLLHSYWAAERRGRTSAMLQDIVQLALANKVKHLFVNEKMHVWGRINRNTASFTYSPRQTDTEDDVLDDLAEIVLRNHGAVTVLPASKMPEGKAACAILSGEAVSLRRSIALAHIPDEAWRPEIAS